MFSWFRSQSRCPVEPRLQEWTESRMAWLVDQFGMDRLKATRVILPSAEFFPEPYSPTPRGARALLDRVCGYMGVKPESVELGFYAQQHPDSAGLYERTADSAKVWLEVSDVQDPVPVIAVMAHEAAHHLLLGEGRLTGDEDDHEPLTDLLTIFLGFGVFTTAAMLSESNYTSGNWHFSKSKRLGYLSFPVCGYALAIFARNRQETKPAWVDYLRLDVKQVFQLGQRFLAENGLSGLTCHGPRPFYAPDSLSPRPQVDDEHDRELAEPSHESAESVEKSAEADGHEAEGFDRDENVFPVPESDYHFTHGTYLLREGNYAEALAAFTQAIQSNPDDLEGYLHRAACYRHLARFHEALADAEQAVRLDPDECSANRVRARAYFDLKKLAESIKDCDIVLRKRREDASTYHLRGLAHAGQGDHDRAIKDFGLAIRYEPQVVAYYQSRAISLERLGRYEEANRDRMEAIRRDPFSIQS